MIEVILQKNETSQEIDEEKAYLGLSILHVKVNTF